MAPAGDDGSGRTADVDELEQSSIGGSDSGSTVRSAQEHYGLTSPQEQTVLERVARSRMKWRWRRLRIAIFLALMLVAEVRAAQHIFDFYMPGKMDQVGGDDTPGDPYSQKALPIGSITTPFYFYMLLALVPTDRILVRLAAIAVVVSSFVAWGMERSALHSCSSFPAYPEATVIFCHEPAQAGVGRFARWMVITGSFASVVTAALAARALLVRVERTTRGGLAVCWRSPTHIALQRLWEALVVGLLWRIAFVIPSGVIMGLISAPSFASAGNSTIPVAPNASAINFGGADDGWSRAHTDIVLYGLLRAAYILLHGIFCLAPMRRRVQAFLGSACLPLCGNDEVSSLTTVGGLLGPGHEPATALRHARDRFRAVPADGIAHAHMLRARHDGSQLPLTALARPMPLGACDAFISHAWLDCPGRRFEALARWHCSFRKSHGRTALVWLDQFCIDASSVRADLACIGSFIAGCRQFVLLASPSYATRLWCVLELVTFLEMGAKISDVLVVPLVPPRTQRLPPAHRAMPLHELDSAETPFNETNCPLRAWIAQQRKLRQMASVNVREPLPCDVSGRADAASHLPSSATCDVAVASAVDVEMAMDGQPMPLSGGNAPPSAPPSPSPLPATPLGLLGSLQEGDLPHINSMEYAEGGRREEVPTASPREDAPSDDEVRAAFYAAIEPLTRFDVQKSRCHCPNDFGALLAFIESAFGSHHCFNRKVRLLGSALLKRADRAI